MLNNSGLNMEDYSIPPPYHQNDTYLENVNDSNELTYSLLIMLLMNAAFADDDVG